AKGKDGARQCDSCELSHRLVQLGQVLEHAEAGDGVERAISEWHRIQAALVQLGSDVLVLEHLVNLVGVDVDVDSHEFLRAPGELREQQAAAVTNLQERLEL